MISFVLNFIASSSFFALVMALLYGHLTVFISALSLILGIATSAILFEKEKVLFSSLSRWLASLIFGVGAFQFIYIFFESQSFKATLQTLNPNNLGDLPFHINLIRLFSSGTKFWPENPLVIGERLKYPFGMDLFNALWEQVGVALSSHLALTGLVTLLITLLAFQRWLGAWGIVCFFFSGGFASFHELLQGTSWLPGTSIDFKNLFLSVFVTQRGFLYALPAGLWILHQISLWQEKKSLDEDESQQVPHEIYWRPRVSFFLIYGTLPFFHLHSFFILSVYLVGKLLLEKNGRLILHVLMPAWFLAFPFVLQALLGGIPNKSIYLSWGWMSQETNPFVFWMRNLGTWFALLPALLWVSWKDSDSRKSVLWVVGLFAIFSNLMLAPWAWDQIKILLWCYLLINAEMVNQIFKKMNRQWKIGAAVLLFYPGIFQLWASLPTQIRKHSPAVILFDRSELETIAPLLTDVSSDHRVLAAPLFNHPILYFGKKVVLGYPGHIWSQGVDATILQGEIKKVFEAQAPTSVIGADWALWTPYERDYFKVWPTALGEIKPESESQLGTESFQIYVWP